MSREEPRKRWLFFAHNQLAEPALAEVLDVCRGCREVEPWFTREEAAGDPRAGLGTRLVRKLRRELFPFDCGALFRGLGEIAEENGRFRLLRPDRTFDALAAADVLVSDLSSVTVEFTLFDRPIALSEPPGFRPWDPALAAAYRDASHAFQGPEELSPALEAALDAPDARRTGRTALRDLCLSHLGHSGERIVSLVLARV